MDPFIVQKQGISYQLNNINFTANVVKSPKAWGNIFIPRSINYQSHEYDIINISQESFKDNHKIKSIRFPEDSLLRSIEKESFSNTLLESLFIPSSVKNLEKGWCKDTSELHEILISPQNNYYKKLDDQNKIIVGKTDKNSEIYDILIFADRDITQVQIPNTIKYISSYAFNRCNNLTSIFISEDSMLCCIDENSFSYSNLENIFIPKTLSELKEGWCKDTPNLMNISISPMNNHFKYLDENHQIIIGKSSSQSENYDVILFANRDIRQVKIPKSIKYIHSYAFDCCKKLKIFEIPENSELLSIGQKVFTDSLIKTFFIPAKLEILKEGWCSDTPKLKNVSISPENKNFKFLDKKCQIIVGKSDKNNENYDVIVFANRGIEEAIIPKNIKRINSNAFENCINLKTVEFSENSELYSIGKYSFSATSIKQFIIPKSVNFISKCAFSWCHVIQKVVIETFSELHSIPDHLFFFCSNLKKIEIPDECSITSIGCESFRNSSIESLSIPSKVEIIKEDWCNETPNLNKVTISPMNKNFKYADENHQLIVKKSDNNGEIYDELIFASRDIKFAKIPKYVKYINMRAFDNCTNLTTIEIPEDSELLSIGSESLYNISIKSLFMPSKFERFEEGYFYANTNLNEIKISPMNKNFKYLDEEHQIIVGKSDINSEIFDTIVFASHNIKNAIIPKCIKHICPYAFYRCKKLTSIQIPNDTELKSIGKYAFYATSIKKFIIPKSVQSIGESAFSWCDQLLKVEIEKESKLTSISSNLFSWSQNLKSIKIHEDSKIKSIENNSFTHTSIDSIFIPSEVEIIEENCLNGTRDLKNIIISPDNKNFKYEDKECQIIVGKRFCSSKTYDSIIFANRNIENLTIPPSISYISSFAFQLCKKLKTIKIPEDSKLKKISKGLFSFSSIETIYISSNIEEIQSGFCKDTPKLNKIVISPLNKHFKYIDAQEQILARKSDNNSEVYDDIIFASRNISSAIIPKYVKYIRSYAFEGCTELFSISFHEESELETIGESAFSNSALQNITIPKQVRKINFNTFSWCDELKYVTIENNSKLESFSNSIFSYSNLEEINIPCCINVRNIYEDSFASTRIQKFYISPNVESIDENWCNGSQELREITVSSSNKNFKYANDEKNMIVGKSDIFSDAYDILFFVNHDVKRIVLPKTIKHICQNAISKCNNLDVLKIPEGSELNAIKSDLLSNTGIHTLKISSSIDQLEKGWCRETSNLNYVKISPMNKKYKYLDDKHQIIVEKSDINSDVYDKIIFASRNIKHVFIPKYIKHIGSFAFEYCKSIKSFEIEKDSQLKSIGRYSFSHSVISDFTIPKEVEKINTYCFAWCESLKKVTIEEGSKLNSILNNCFYWCKKLTTFEIPENSSLKFFDSDSFYYTSLEKIYIPTSVEEIKYDCFNDTPKLNKVTISPLNKNFKYADNRHQVLLGKSDFYSDIFDVIIFVSNSIEKIVIPSSIQNLNMHLLRNCNKLKSIDFADDSKICSITGYSFYGSSLENLRIPRNINKYDHHIYDDFKNLKFVEFLGDSLIDGNIFKGRKSLLLASFPNVHELTFCGDFSLEFSLFVSAGIKVNFISNK